MDIDMITEPPPAVAAASPGPQVSQGESCLLRYMRTKFPVEILIRIVDLIDADAFRNLRMTCRELEEALVTIFQKRFVNHRHVIYNFPSCRKLADIVGQPKLAPHVTSLAFQAPDQVTSDDLAVFDAGLDHEFLFRALSGLPNLKALTVYSPRDRWSGGEINRKLFKSVLHAAARAGVNLESLGIFRKGGTGGGLDPERLYIPASLVEDFAPALRSLKRLTLALSPYLPTHHGSVADFLSMVPNLEFLRLNLDRGHRLHCDAILEAIRNSPSWTAPPTLRELQLGKMIVKPDALLTFVRHFAPTLTHLEFFRIGLEVRDWNQPPAADEDVNTDEAKLWRAVFRRLAENSTLAGVSHFKAGYLTESGGYHVSFKADPVGCPGITDDEAASSPECHYNGLDVSRFLQEVSKGTNKKPPPSRRPPAPTHADLVGDDDEEELDDEMDDDEGVDNEFDDELGDDGGLDDIGQLLGAGAVVGPGVGPGNAA